MRVQVFRVTYLTEDKHENTIRRIEWFGTGVQAFERHEALTESGDGSFVEAACMFVPTDKPGLLEWLNLNATGDTVE